MSPEVAQIVHRSALNYRSKFLCCAEVWGTIRQDSLLMFNLK